MIQIPCFFAIDAICLRMLVGMVTPVGLLGEHSMSAFVLGVMSRSISTVSGIKLLFDVSSLATCALDS